MLRVSLVRRSFTHDTFNRMITHIKKRDPNERHLRAGFLFMEMMKRMHAYVVALLFVAAGTAFVQFQDPASVRPPVQDGRSLVT